MVAERPLMKCPHCGKLNWSCVEYSSTGAHQIQCTTCRAAGPIGDSRDNAMELWNWRALDEARPTLETAAVREFTTKLPKMGMSTVCDLCGETFGNHIAQHPDGRTSACPTVTRRVNS
jgi:hypothetical protein